MSNHQYLVKAENNRLAAIHSEDEERYHVAIGRYYYHYFLIGKYNLIDKWKIPEDRFKSRSYSTHIQFRLLLKEIFNSDTWGNRITNDDITSILSYIEDLCDLRVKAEYTNYEYNKNRYQSTCVGIVRKLDILFKKIGFKEQ